MHTPARHAPRLHVVPSGFGCAAHAPVAAMHALVTSHSPGAGHDTIAPPQVPAVHVSFIVHALLSLHALPVAAPHTPSTAAPALTLHA
jgi:hypothetical protein